MASNLNEILGRNIDSVKSLKAAIKELQDSLVGLDTDSQEYKDTATKLIAAQDALKDTTRAGVEANTAAKDSIVGLQKEYNKLYDAYKKLSDEQRNSDIGKGMAESLEKLSTSINDNNKEVGNFKTNIGHYAESATEAFNKMGVSIGELQTPLKMAAGGTKTLGTALKTLAANPIVLVITALVAILAKAAEAIKKNEELTNRLKEALSVFQPVVNAISNAFDWLAEKIVKVVEGFGKLFEKIASIIPGMKEQIQLTKELTKAENDLNKSRRTAREEQSKKNAEIEKLREEASETDNLVEKREKLQEAARLQKEIDEENIKLAEDELHILEENAKLTANDEAAEEALTEARIRLQDATATLSKNERFYNKQLDATTKKTGGATSAAKNYREEAKKLHEQLLDDNKTEIQKLTEKYEKEKKLLEKYHYDTKLLTKKYEQEVAKIQEEASLKTLAQRRTDLAREWQNTERSGNRSLAVAKRREKLYKDTLPDVVSFERQIYEMIRQDNSLEALINDKTFEGLDERYKGLTKTVRRLNAEYGLSITTVTNLEETIDELKMEIRELQGDFSKLEVEDTVKNSEIANIGTELYSVLNDNYKDYLELVERNAREALEAEQAALYDEITTFQGTEDQKIELLKRYYAIAQELRDKDMQAVQLNADRIQEVMESALDFSSSIEGMINGVEQLMQAEIQSGKLTEKEAARKQKALENLQKVQLGVAIANIAANTAAGIMDVWRGYSSELVLNAQTAAAAGPGAAISKAALDAKSLASAILRTSTLAMQGGSQIAAAVGGYISKGSAGAEGQDVGVGATPALIDTTPYTYSRTVQTTEEEDRLNAPIFVTVTDIEEGLGHKATVTNESSF